LEFRVSDFGSGVSGFGYLYEGAEGADGTERDAVGRDRRDQASLDGHAPYPHLFEHSRVLKCPVSGRDWGRDQAPINCHAPLSTPVRVQILNLRKSIDKLLFALDAQRETLHPDHGQHLPEALPGPVILTGASC